MKEFVDATTITKYILDLGMNLTIVKLLVLALAVEKQFIKAITKDKTIQFCVNTLKSSFGDTLNSNSWYSMSFLKAKFKLEDGFKVTSLLDTCAKINVITRKVIENVGLTMQYSSKL